MSLNLTGLAIRGFKWSYLSAMVNIALVTAMTAVLARLLEPSAFGLIAMANILLRITSYFTAGIEPAIIQKKELSQADIRTSFTVSALLSISIFALVWLLAPFAMNFMPSPEIVPVLRVLAFSLLITGFSVTAIGLLKRKLEFRTLALIEITAYFIGYCCVGLSLAALDYGIWSLVAASLTQAVVTGLLAYGVSRHGCRPTLDRSSRAHLFSFGGKATALGFLEFLGFNIDNLIIGRMMGPAALGLYTRAMALVDMPVQAVSTPLLRVSFPAMSQLQSDFDKLREAYASTLTVLVVISVPVAFGVIPAASSIVLTLLGPKWIEAIPVLQALAVLIPLAMITGFLGSICTATGFLNGRLWVQGLFVIALPAAILAFADDGLAVIAMVVVAAHFTRFVAYLILVQRILDFPLGDLGKCLLPGMVSAASVFLTISAAHGALAGQPVLLSLLAEMLVGGLTLLAVVLIMPSPTMVPMLRRLRAQTDEPNAAGHVIDWLLKRYAQ